MSFSETFDSDLGSYTASATAPGYAQYDGSTGNPTAGCAKLYGGYDGVSYYDASIIDLVDTHLVATGEKLYWNGKFIASGIAGPFAPATQIFTVLVTFSDALSLFFSYYGSSLITAGQFPNGPWLQFEFDLSSRVGNTINGIYLYLTPDAPHNWENQLYVTAYLDGVEFATSAPPFDPIPSDGQFKYLGLSSDSTNLYAAANDGGELKLIAYNLETLIQDSEASFGASTYLELDARTRGIFPVVKPGNDGVLFVRGRDGNGNQVLLSDDYGATFADASDSGWAVAKYCVGLLPDPLNPADLMACFDDNDLYQSQDGSASWVKTGDAPATLRAAARHPTIPEELLLGAQANDTLYWTGNLGVSSEDVLDVALNQINVIEVSRPPGGA